MARKIDRRQKPAWQKVRKPIPRPPKKKYRDKTSPPRTK